MNGFENGLESVLELLYNDFENVSFGFKKLKTKAKAVINVLIPDGEFAEVFDRIDETLCNDSLYNDFRYIYKDKIVKEKGKEYVELKIEVMSNQEYALATIDVLKNKLNGILKSLTFTDKTLTKVINYKDDKYLLVDFVPSRTSTPFTLVSLKDFRNVSVNSNFLVTHGVLKRK